MFVSNHGSPYPRFKRALATGNLTIIRAAAAELPHVDLADALAVCVLLRDQEPARFEAAALRWLARFAIETPAITLERLEAAVSAFRAMTAEPERALTALQQLVRH